MVGERLGGLDTAFLQIENENAHMHIGVVLTFAGEAPRYDDLIEVFERRLHLVPRYRQRLLAPPLPLDRPRWVDDPHFNLRFHVRHTGLPAPGSEEQLKELAARILGQRLDRERPLWEFWLVEGLEGNRFAVIAKTHHAVVDGVSGVDVVTLLLDATPEPSPTPPPPPWLPRPLPSRAELLVESLAGPLRTPLELAKVAQRSLAHPEEVVSDLRRGIGGALEFARAAFLRGGPRTPYNGKIGPHRRFDWVRFSLADLRAIKARLGGTVNDVVLACVAGALHHHLLVRGERVEGVELKTLVPVSVRADVERGALGNRVSLMIATLPVWCADPATRFAIVRDQMAALKESGQAVGAKVLTELGDFAPPTILAQASRLFATQRVFNLVVTNVPGPQFPLYMLGRRLIDPFPVVPLAPDQTLGVALMSYDGRINFGLIGDYDRMWDLRTLARCVRRSMAELAEAAGIELEEPSPYPRPEWLAEGGEGAEAKTGSEGRGAARGTSDGIG
ncbi:acyltransferase, WS/DGAT/MGAT [Thermoleophilum album]|uniref:Diacylglycerol O-acyltransferase n=1 Tax=Thermoleophilum album TaxID=29539 RepID=A0A1H6FUR1_THEAL|nr:acyltransferase, WS/DGAT/MGAT [Thermoleophilum album]